MKQFLRYQISGTVFLLWLIVFYHGATARNIRELLACVQENIHNLEIFSGVVSALPIGVMIHQFSVLLKNFLIGLIWKEFDDFPKYENIKKLDNGGPGAHYVMERISNLNSFYYVRFDNGILSPILAWVTISCFMHISINAAWIILAFVIGVVTAVYIPRLRCEIKYYNETLKKL